MKSLVVLCALLFSCGTVAAEIYQWIDESGKRHFSDRQADQAESVELFDSHSEIVPSDQLSGRSQPATKSKNSRPTKKSITASDYNINVNASQLRDKVYLSGRISEGPPCLRLKLDFTLQDEDGHLIHLITVTKNIGGFLSDIVEASKRVKYGDTDSKWNIIETSGVCQK